MDIIIIPAYEPDESLVKLADDFINNGCKNLVIVDDGSGEKFNDIFDKLRQKGLTVLVHSQNKGKGAAMKTAMKYIKDNFSGDYFAVTVDSDGQHSPQDTFKLLEFARNNPQALSLGVRQFSGKIPFRSKLGNNVTKVIFKLCSGVWVSDTQTGLRAFPSSFLSKMLEIDGDRYEYEMNMLLYCANENIKIAEMPIETIYHDMQNSCSHFDTLRDTKRICKVLFTADGSALKFICASATSFVTDYILFFPMTSLATLAFSPVNAVSVGNVAARILSASLNYFLNSTFVFNHKQNHLKSFPQYAILATAILILNTFVLYIFNTVCGIPKAIAKIFTEIILFIISYTVQKYFIFKKKKNIS